MNQSIVDLIQKDIEQRTFSLEAVDAIKKLLDERDLLKNGLEGLQNKQGEIIKENFEIKQKIEKLQQESKKIKDRDLELVAKENELHKKEIKQAEDRATSKAYVDCFNLIFKNTKIREEVTRNISTTNSSGYNAESKFEDEKKEIEEE